MLWLNIVLRLAFVVLGALLGAEGWGILVGGLAGLVAYGVAVPLLKRNRWNWVILLTGLELCFQVREWVLAFGWQAGFQTQLLLLTAITLLFDHFSLKRRITLALLPIALYWISCFMLSGLVPAIPLSEPTLLTLQALNVTSFVVVAMMIVVYFAQIATREKERAQHLAESRARVVANLSHELKTPIAAILTTAQSMLRHERTSDKYKQALRLCERNSRSMSQLIRRMLDLAKAGSDAWEPNLQTLDLRELLATSIDLHTPLAQDDGVDMLLVCKEGQSIESDADLLLIMVNNLLGNAIRYTPRGKAVIIRYSPANKDHGPMISVIDEGPGIRPEVLPHIFDAFYQDQEVRSRQSAIHSNYGLGLALTAELAERLKIKIEVESSPGNGAAFHLIFPVAH